MVLPWKVPGNKNLRGRSVIKCLRIRAEFIGETAKEREFKRRSDAVH